MFAKKVKKPIKGNSLCVGRALKGFPRNSTVLVRRPIDMQSPSVEINAVIKLISSSATPDIQKAAIYKYFTADVGYRHPLCAVEPAPKSREEVLGVYQ